MSLFYQEKEQVWSEWELQSLLRYIQSLESKPYSDEQKQAQRIQGLLDDPYVSETYKQSLRDYLVQKDEITEKIFVQSN